MANLHPTTDTDFQKRQYGQTLPEVVDARRKNQRSIQNATADTRLQDTRRKRIPDQPTILTPGIAPHRRPRTQQQQKIPRRITTRQTPLVMSLQGGGRLQKKLPMNAVVHATAFARVVPLSLFIASWSGFIWITIQLPASIVSLVMFAAVFIVSENWIWDTINSVYNYIGEFFGFSSVSLIVLFFIPAGITLIFSWGCLATALMQYKLAGINPIFGSEGVTAKKGTFLAALICSIIPGLNFVPWIWLWLLMVIRYPK